MPLVCLCQRIFLQYVSLYGSDPNRVGQTSLISVLQVLILMFLALKHLTYGAKRL